MPAGGGELVRARRPVILASERLIVQDLLVVAVTLLFFAVSWLIVRACERV